MVFWLPLGLSLPFRWTSLLLSTSPSTSLFLFSFFSFLFSLFTFFSFCFFFFPFRFSFFGPFTFCFPRKERKKGKKKNNLPSSIPFPFFPLFPFFGCQTDWPGNHVKNKDLDLELRLKLKTKSFEGKAAQVLLFCCLTIGQSEVRWLDSHQTMFNTMFISIFLFCSKKLNSS